RWVGVGQVRVGDGEQQHPEIKDAQREREAEERKQEHEAEVIAAERKVDEFEMQGGGPAKVLSEFPIENRAEKEERKQRGERAPAFGADGVGLAQRANERGGGSFGQRVEAERQPIPPKR